MLFGCNTFERRTIENNEEWNLVCVNIKWIFQFELLKIHIHWYRVLSNIFTIVHMCHQSLHGKYLEIHGSLYAELSISIRPYSGYSTDPRIESSTIFPRFFFKALRDHSSNTSITSWQIAIDRIAMNTMWIQWTSRKSALTPPHENLNKFVLVSIKFNVKLHKFRQFWSFWSSKPEKQIVCWTNGISSIVWIEASIGSRSISKRHTIILLEQCEISIVSVRAFIVLFYNHKIVCRFDL